MAPPQTNARRNLSAYDRAQLSRAHAGNMAANGYAAPAPGTLAVGNLPRRRRGRPRKGAALIEGVRPPGYRPDQGLLRELDVSYTFSGDGRRLYTDVEQTRTTAVSGGLRKRARVASDTSGDAEGSRQSRPGIVQYDGRGWQPMTDTDGPPTHDEDGQWEDIPEGDGRTLDGDSGGSPAHEPAGGAQPQPAKRYKSSDDPMSVWLPLQDAFMAQLMTREHPGGQAACVTCKATWVAEVATADGRENMATDVPITDATTDALTTDALYRCQTCGEFLECKDCSLKRHQRSPCHVLRVWRNKGFFERTSLRAMGLTYQLGHGGGSCAVPQRGRIVTVMHVNGVHRVHVEFCGCDRHADDVGGWKEPLVNGWFPATTVSPQTFATLECLTLYRRLNTCGHVNVRDFISALERLTDPLGIDWVPDRYKAFNVMSRQWSFLVRMRRRGIGHRSEGIASAPLGSAVIDCWACPRPKVNLPEGWRTVEGNMRFKYQLFLGLDANFRMESKLRTKSKHKAYPILADGLGSVMPSEEYKEHLRKYVKEEDVSTCIAFAALMQKETRQSAGLRCTGVGGCICTRHESILRIGDLLKGERYANMDYVFWSAIMHTDVADIMVSYDIGCQWKVNLVKRREGMPSLLKEDPGGEPVRVHVALPVWHGAVHEEDCTYCNSLRYKIGAGMTDGEGVERVWSALIGLAVATKEMHDDARHENLEDTIDHHNFRKNLSLVALIPKRLEVARDERAKQLENFRRTSLTLAKEVRERWEQDIKLWHEQEDWPKKKQTVKCPYVSHFKKEMLTEKSVREDLQAEELEAAKVLGGGILPKGRKTSKTMFLTLGMKLRDLQLRILSSLKARVRVDEHRNERLSQQRKTFEKGLTRFRALQETYMSGVRLLIDADEEAATLKGVATAPEAVRLWLPSDIPAASRPTIGTPELYKMEAELRRAQCSEALQLLRIRLHAKRHMIMFRNAYMRGQRKTGRARTLIDSISDRVDALATKYRESRAALSQLEGDEGCGEFRVLEREDVKLRYVQDHDARAARRMAKIAGRESQNIAQGTDLCDDEDDNDESNGAEERGESRRVLSWIWTAQGAPDDSEEYLLEAVRIEWCRSHARKERWREEVAIGEEEQNRTLLSLLRDATEWRERAEWAFGPIRERLGRRAYALRQAAVYENLHATFVQRWEDNNPTKRKRRRDEAEDEKQVSEKPDDATAS